LRILLINHYAGSPAYGMEFRPFYLGREWSRNGWEVQIEAAAFSHLRRRNPENRRHTETTEGVLYSWWPTPSYEGNGPARVRNIASFTTQLLRDSRRIARSFRPDVVVASSTYPFDIYPAQRIAAASSARLIFELHDLWPLTPIELGGMSPLHPFIVACAAAERYAYRHADAIVSMLPAAEAHMLDRGLAPGKFTYVPNGFDVAEWGGCGQPMPAEHASTLSRLRSENRFVVGFAGSHGLANALDTLVEAAVLLRGEHIAIVLVGHGPERDRLQQKALSLGLADVHFLPPIPKASIPDLLGGMDALYIGWLRRPIYRFGIGPNKMLDYLMSARPIIHGVEAGNDPVAESGCGVSIPPENPAALADAIRDLSRVDRDARLAMGARGRQFALAHHDFRVLARRFMDVAEGRSADADVV